MAFGGFELAPRLGWREIMGKRKTAVVIDHGAEEARRVRLRRRRDVRLLPADDWEAAAPGGGVVRIVRGSCETLRAGQVDDNRSRSFGAREHLALRLLKRFALDDARIDAQLQRGDGMPAGHNDAGGVRGGRRRTRGGRGDKLCRAAHARTFGRHQEEGGCFDHQQYTDDLLDGLGAALDLGAGRAGEAVALRKPAAFSMSANKAFARSHRLGTSCRVGGHEAGRIMARSNAKKALVGRVKIMRVVCGRIFGWGTQVSGIGRFGPGKWLSLPASHCRLGAQNRLVCGVCCADCEPALVLRDAAARLHHERKQVALILRRPKAVSKDEGGLADVDYFEGSTRA